MDENPLIRTKHPLTNADLIEVEKAFHFTFPSEFRRHYLRYNGGSPERNLFKKNNRIFVVQEFLQIKFGTREFEETFRDFKIDNEILPKNLVPFAVDPGGDYYCFSIGDEDRGSIWFYVGEYHDQQDRAAEYLTKSLPAFLEGMTREEE